MRGTVAAIGGAAGDIDDPTADAALLEMEHRQPAQFGGCSQVYLDRPVPVRQPFRIIKRIGLEHAGIVDQHVNAALEPFQRLLPKGVSCCNVREIRLQETRLPRCAVSGHQYGIIAPECVDDRLADTAACARYQHMCFLFGHGH